MTVCSFFFCQSFEIIWDFTKCAIISNILAQNYLCKCGDAYLIFQNKHLSIYEDSFGAKIFRDDYTLNSTIPEIQIPSTLCCIIFPIKSLPTSWTSRLKNCFGSIISRNCSWRSIINLAQYYVWYWLMYFSVFHIHIKYICIYISVKI